MKNLLCTIELIFISIASISCSIDNFINGCNLITTAGENNIATGIMTIILAISVDVLAIIYYQFYKLLE